MGWCQFSACWNGPNVAQPEELQAADRSRTILLWTSEVKMMTRAWQAVQFQLGGVGGVMTTVEKHTALAYLLGYCSSHLTSLWTAQNHKLLPCDIKATHTKSFTVTASSCADCPQRKAWGIEQKTDTFDGGRYPVGKWLTFSFAFV